MADPIFYSISIFLVSLFVLDFGVDKFIDHTIKLGKKTGVNPGLIALLTVGAEWEELTVVVASISQSNSPLAMGNIVGSCISNIIGAFCLGLIFSKSKTVFDRSSKIYTAVMMGLMAVFVVLVLFGDALGRYRGGIMLAGFVGYITSIGWAIWKGVMNAPVRDDCCCGSSPDSDDVKEPVASTNKDKNIPTEARCTKPCDASNSENPSEATGSGNCASRAEEEAPRLEALAAVDLEASPLRPRPQNNRSVVYHIFQLLFGLAALSLSSYTLSHAVSNLADSFHLSSTVIGSTLLSFATTLPEKFISVVATRKGESGVMVATTAGSDIFLVTLCAGVLFASGDLHALKGSVGLWEMMWVLGSAAILGVVVLGKWGGRRWMGYVMALLYIGFVVGEFWLGGAGHGIEP